MLGSTLLGFCAILPGRKVTLGDTWKWKGDLLNVAGGGNLVGTFKLESVDDQKVRISCRIDEGWKNTVPKVRGQLSYSRKLGLPLSSRYDYKSKKREAHVRTEARWLPKVQKATDAAAKKAKKAQ